MAEHLIRLRGGWVRDVPGQSPHRVTLPVIWPPDLVSPFRLVRRFNPPRIDPRSETLHLRLEEVAGLVAVSLDGIELARPSLGTSRLILSVDGPTARTAYVLALDVDPAGWEVVEGDRPPWGAIALVVGSA